MRRISGLGAALGAAAIGLSGPAAAQEQARPNVILRETVEGMPRGERRARHAPRAHLRLRAGPRGSACVARGCRYGRTSRHPSIGGMPPPTIEGNSIST